MLLFVLLGAVACSVAGFEVPIATEMDPVAWEPLREFLDLWPWTENFAINIGNGTPLKSQLES